MTEPLLARIAAALERLAPEPASHAPEASGAFHWDGHRLSQTAHFAPVSIDLLCGIDLQRDAVLENGRRLATGSAAHDILLWGARGSGKSVLVKSGVAALQSQGHALALVEVPADRIESLPALFAILAIWKTPVILFIDDLAFEGGEAGAARILRSLLEGGASARPPHIRLYVTSNRRHIVARSMSEQDDPINPRDVADDRLALADRFGLSLGFHVCDQDQYLAMVAGYAKHLGLEFDTQDALTWSTQRGARSGRVAWHYAVELAGRAGKAV